MKTSYYIFPDHRIALYRVEGKPTLEGCIRLFSGMMDDPLFTPEYRCLGDMRLGVSNLTIEELKALSDYLTQKNRVSKQWVVLVSEPMITATSTIVREAVSHALSLTVCSTLERASELLQLDVEPLLDFVETMEPHGGEQ